MSQTFCTPVGGFEHLLFFHVLGIIIPTDELIFFRGLKLPNYQPVAVQFSQEGAEFEIVLDFNARDKRKARRGFTMAGASHKA